MSQIDSISAVDFAGTPAATVRRHGLVFRAGDYPAKSFSLTAAELADAARDFQPVPVDIEHAPSILDGKLGTLAAVQVGDDGETLFGDLDIPEWLHQVIGDEPLKVSACWDRETKRLAALALVRAPHITDAAMMAAFAAFAGRHDTPQGQWAVQELHDTAARHGAVCEKGNANMASRHEATAVQQIHDLAASHGAKCASGGKSAMYSAPERGKETKPMNAWEKFKALLGGIEVPDEPPAPAAATTPTAGMSATPPPPAAAPPDPRIEALEAQVKRERGARIAAEAAAFADGEVAAHRALPAERPTLTALFVQAAEDDDAREASVAFAEGKQGSRVEALRALCGARPAHTLTQEMLATASALFNREETPDPDAEKPMDEARRRQLLGMTTLGQATLANGGGK